MLTPAPASRPIMSAASLTAGLLVVAACFFPYPLWGAEVNLARGPGTAPFGSGSDGPFVIPKINDGRLDGPMAMWCSPGTPGSFIGIKLGESPVAFNAVRFYLFSSRSEFTGWRLEGSDDCQIDEDTALGVFYDPEVIAADTYGSYANTSGKENNLVTVTFPTVSYRHIRLVLPNASPRVGIMELEVFNRSTDASAPALVDGSPEAAVDARQASIGIAGACPVADLLAHLAPHAGVTLSIMDAAGAPLAMHEQAKGGCHLLARTSSGGGASPASTACVWFSIIDRSAPPAPPAVRTRTAHPPLPPKPAVSPPSAPEAPGMVRNLVIGATMTTSIYPGKTADMAKTGSGDWFAGQHFPQWLAIDFGSAIEFDYLSFTGIQIIHCCIQTSIDGTSWDTLVEVDHQRKPWVWNGCFAPVTARYLRLVAMPPSWDVHLRRITVAKLAKPMLDADGMPITVLRPGGPVAGLESLPPVAVADPGARGH
jgi:hypothetical protein